mmetsp:Transcript_5483/g.6048  ORF Transcript_5483/g.6048 Transcript_5483/m.6048 type:complete len:526 (+) Transcript_5483:37-1614(+)
MFLQLIVILQNVFEQTYHYLLASIISIAILIVVANRFGWLDRWIWFVLESEARKAMNGARVTLGSFSIVWAEILQGKITLHASNVVIPTPQRAEWRWDSPLIARIGKATVECNAPITVFHAVFLRREVPIEAYTIIVADIQVFVERRDSLINVFLLNPTLQLPPPPRKVKDQYDNEVNGDHRKEICNDKDGIMTIDSMKGPSSAVSRKENTEHTDMYPLLSTKAKTDRHDHDSLLQPVQEETTFFENGNKSDEVSSDHHQQAKILVNEMLHAVQVLGGAAARGQLPGAIKQQGLELVGRLRGFREQENLEEGIRVMQQMGKVAVESLQSAPQLIMPKPDTSREGKKKTIYIRVGRIIIDDMRIFTKDSWINETTTQMGHDSSSTATARVAEIPCKSNNSFHLPPPAKKINAGTSKNTATKIDMNNKQNGSWNKPIYIERMVLRPSELSPSMSMVDCNNLPAIYHSVDKVVEVVLRRLLVEIAKSNTGKLFSTAIGEVLSVMVSNPHHSAPLPSTANTTTSSSPAM